MEIQSTLGAQSQTWLGLREARPVTPRAPISPSDLLPGVGSVHALPDSQPPALMLLGPWRWQGQVQQT